MSGLKRVKRSKGKWCLEREREREREREIIKYL